MDVNEDVGRVRQAEPGSRASTETAQTVSALTGFDPSRVGNCTCGGAPDQPADHHDISCPAAIAPSREPDCATMAWDDPRRIFVFGSNLAGRHGKGAALYARQRRGAIYGQSEGLQGNSYALPTKDGSLRTLPLEAVREHAKRFIAFARTHPELRFQLTAVGCGLAGYQPSDIAPMFEGAPPTVELPPEFKDAMLGHTEGIAQPPPL